MSRPTINDALRAYLKDLGAVNDDGSVNVPSETTIKLLGELNAKCARVMSDMDWFPSRQGTVK